MKVASTTVDITPHGVFYMEGYNHPVRQQPATGVHDTPLAILLLLGEDGNEVLFVSLDVCIAPADATAQMRAGLSDCLGIEPDRIVISAIHSHSCPKGFDGTLDLVKGTSQGWATMVSGLVVEAATTLRAKKIEARPELLKACVRGFYSNRNDRDAAFDDSAYVLRFVADDGTVAGAMLNFNCHATVVGPLNTLLTTDIQGAVRSELAEWIGIMPYGFTGASADLGNRQYRKGAGFAELRRAAVGISAQIMQGSFEPVELAEPQVSLFSHRVTYNNEDLYPLYRRQLAEVAEALERPHSFDDEKLLTTERDMLEQQLGRGRVDFTVRMATIDLGGLVLVTFPGELASELGMRVKAAFGGRSALVVGYANDYCGYFVPAHVYGGTSYESYVTWMPQGWTETMLDRFEQQI